MHPSPLPPQAFSLFTSCEDTPLGYPRLPPNCHPLPFLIHSTDAEGPEGIQMEGGAFHVHPGEVFLLATYIQRQCTLCVLWTLQMLQNIPGMCLL